MSMQLMVAAMGMSVGNPTRKLVLLKLADQANDKGECWPSYQTIADAAECSKRAAMLHIQALEEMGLLRVVKRKTSDKQNLSNIYCLTLGKGSENSAPHSENSALGSENGSLGVVKISTGGSENSAPKPVIEPVNKNQSMKHSADASAPPSAKPKIDKDKAQLALLAEIGVTGQLADDWLAIRKAKRQPLTPTALRLLQNEAQKANLSVVQAVEYAVGVGWAGFRADWLQNRMGFAKPAKSAPPSNFFSAEYFENADYGDGIRDIP